MRRAHEISPLVAETLDQEASALREIITKQKEHITQLVNICEGADLGHAEMGIVKSIRSVYSAGT